MQTHRIALLAGGLVIAGTTIATAQDLAAAVPPPKSELTVFTEKGSPALSPTALETVGAVARQASLARPVTLTGRPESVAVVKSALERHGVPAALIVARRDTRAPLPRSSDGLSDPSERHVDITF